METTIKFSDVINVEEFVEISNKYPFKIVLKSGKIELDAKSIMSLFSLEFSKPIQLIAETDSAEEYFEDIDSYIVQDN